MANRIVQWTALQWLSAFRKRFSVPNLSGQALAWTGYMFPLLHQVQGDLGAWCQCGTSDAIPGRHGPRGEYLNIDMMWFDPMGGDWDAPLMALEHENSHERAEARKDFWRVFQVAAPLRVFIGYAATTKSQANRVDDLLRMRDFQQGNNRFHMLQGGEDIALIGHYEMSSFSDWRGVVWNSGGAHLIQDFAAQD